MEISREEQNPLIPCVKDGKTRVKFPEDMAFVLCLKACSRERNAEKGTKIYYEIIKRGLLMKNVAIGNTLIHMYAKCGSLAKAQHVFDEIPIRNVVSWTALIAGYAQFGLSEASVKCFEEMKCEGLHPNEVTFACTLKACGSIGAIEKGKEIHSEIVKEGISQKNDILGTALVDMYAKCGAIQEARKVFDKLCDPSLAVWTALISGYAENGHGEEALMCYERMQHKGLVPDAVTFSCILKACGSIGASEKGKEIHAEILRERLLGKDIILGNALIDMYGKLQISLKAQEIFDEYHLRDVVTWNVLISGYSQQGNGTEALICFKRMQCEAFPPDAVTFSCILKACGISRVLERGIEVHVMIETGGILQMNSMVGSALVEMYAKCGELIKAQKVFGRLPARDVVSWNVLIAECCEQGHGEKALDYFKKMQQEGVSPNAVTFLCTLKASGIIGTAEIGKEIHSKIVKGGFLIEDSTLGTALVDMYAKCGLLQRAKEVFDQIHVRNVISWNSLITGYAQLGEHSNVVDSCKAMLTEGIKPTLVTFTVVLTACSSSGLVNEGQMYFEYMTRKYGLTPDLEHYTCMINLFGCAGHFDKLMELIGQMPSSGYLPAWFALLNACQRWGNVELAGLAFKHVIQLDEKSAWPYVCMNNIYTAAGMLKGIEKIKAMRIGNQDMQLPKQLLDCL